MIFLETFQFSKIWKKQMNEASISNKGYFIPVPHIPLFYSGIYSYQDILSHCYPANFESNIIST